MPVVTLTQQVINAGLKCPEGKDRIELCCSEVRGMYVLVSATRPNEGTYFLRYKDANGKTCHQKLGRTSEIDLAEARKRAKRLKSEIVLGADPRGQANAMKLVPTLDAFFKEMYLPHAKQHKRSWARDVQLYARFKPVFGVKRLNEITRHQLQTFHNGLRDEGLAPSTCDGHLRFVKHALNLAIDWEVMPGPNPAARIPLFRVDNKVEHYLNEEELQRLVHVLQTHRNRTVCNVALFLLATGARCNEALTATWDQIDLDHRVWRIAATNSKSKRIRSVPLNDAALEVLKQVGTKDGHVFVNRRTRAPLTTISRSWERLREAAGFPHLRLHDLRHQFASMLVNAGRTLYEVQQILGHSDMKVTERYAHLSKRTLQEAVNSASVAISAAREAV